MDSGKRLALEIEPEQERKMRAIVRFAQGDAFLQERPLAGGRKLLLVEKQ